MAKDYFPPTSGSTTTSSSSSSSTSTSASSGGSRSSSAPAGPSPQDVANAAASYLNLWASWGIAITPGIKAWVEEHVRAGVTSAQMLALFRKTKAYAQRFPGILKNDGSLRMTESQYVASYNSAKDYAATIGRNLTIQQYGLAIKNGNSPNEVKQKLQALDTLKTSAPMFQEFNDYLQATGVEKKPLKREDLLAFIMGRGPKVWEETWQTAYNAAQIERAGVEVGRKQDISYKGVKKLINQAEAFGTVPTVNDYKALAQQVASVLPLSALYKEGITKKDLVALAFGGKAAPEIASRVQRLMATHEAFATEQRAEPLLVQGPRGSQLRMGGTQTQQATE